jgi:hypothetical protein
MSALKTITEAQASLQEQFDRHVPGESVAGTNSFLRQEPDEEDDEEEEEDDRKE